MKKPLTPLLALLFAFSGVTQIMNAQDNEPHKEEKKKKILGLELGAKLPELNATDQNGKEVPLAATEGYRWVFVFFYPKALTGG